MADGFDASVINAFNPTTKLKTADEIAAAKLELQSRKQSAQLGEQQIQQAKLVTAQALKQQADQRAAAQVFNQNLDGDKTYQGLLRIDPKLASQWQDAQHKRAIDSLDEQSKQLGIQKDKVAELAKITAPVAIAMQAGRPKEEVGSLYAESRRQALARGIATPDQVPEVMDPAHVITAMSAATNAHEQIAEKQTQIDSQAKVAKDAFDMKLAAQKEAQAEKDKQVELGLTANRDKNAAAYQRGRLGIEGARVNIEANKAKNDPSNIDLTNASPADLLAAKALVQGAAGVKDFPTRGNFREKLLALATQIDPNFTTDRKDTIKTFKTGKDAADIAQLNMLGSHLERFDQNSKDTGVMNSFNPLSTDNARLKKDINDVAGVMGRLVKGGVVNKDEGERYLQGLNSHSPSVRAAAADEMRELVKGKLDAAKQKFQAGSGLSFDDYFGKDAVSPVITGGMSSGSKPSLDSFWKK